MLIPIGWRSETKRGRDKPRSDGLGIGCRFVFALPCLGSRGRLRGRWGEGRKLLVPVVGLAGEITKPKPSQPGQALPRRLRLLFRLGVRCRVALALRRLLPLLFISGGRRGCQSPAAQIWRRRRISTGLLWPRRTCPV
jgi:hypothetical protein